MMSEEKVPVEQLGGPVVSADLPNHDKSNLGYPQVSTTDSPPGYFDLFGKVRQAKADSKCNGEYVKNVSRIFKKKKGENGSIFCTLFWMAVPIASIVIGSLNLHNCTVERYIPIYLIVAGSFGVLRSIINVITLCAYKIKNSKCTDCEGNQAQQSEEDDEKDKPKKNPFLCLIDLFLFAWMIAGSVWVYRLYGQVNYDDMNSTMYCDKTTYLYTFWILTITYGFMALGLLFCCCMGMVMCCVGAAMGCNRQCNRQCTRQCNPPHGSCSQPSPSTVVL